MRNFEMMEGKRGLQNRSVYIVSEDLKSVFCFSEIKRTIYAIISLMHFLIKAMILLILIWSPASTIAKEIVSKNTITKIDQFIISQINKQKTIGCAVAIVDQEKIVFIKSYGVLKKGQKTPITENTLFQLGSISKPITATLVAKMLKSKLLSLELDVSTFFPSLSPQMTLRHILSHTTGYNRTQWNQKIEAGTSRTSLLLELSQAETLPPGQSFDYHNVAFSLIEEAISNIKNHSFADSLKAMLLTPLGMTRTIVGDGDFAYLPNFAWPHQKNDKGVLYASKNYSRNYAKTVCSAGGINSTIKDMATFLKLQLGAMPDFLTQEDLTDFHTPQVKTADALKWLKRNGKVTCSYYGLGWRSLDYGQERIVFHGGWLKGFTNFLGFIPDRKVGIVVLNNSEGRFVQEVAFTFFDLIKE